MEESNETRDILEREFDKLEEPTESVETDAPEVEVKSDKSRDDKGRFAKKEPQDEPEAPKEDEVKDEPKEPQENAPKRNPWASWKPEAAAELSKLPENVQKYIVERQEQFHRGIEQYKADANYAKTLNKAIAPYSEYMQQLGVTPEIAFPNLLRTEMTLRTGSPEQKARMFQQLAHDYGIDLGSLAQAPFDPKMHQLEQQLAAMQAQIQASQQSRQSAEDVQISQTIEQFAQNAEFFEDVRETMADLLDRGLAQDLQDAYVKAIRLDDGVFSRYQAQQQANAEKQRLSQADQAAKAAKAAAVSVRGAPTGVNHAAPAATTEEAVRNAMKALGL